MAPLLVQHLQYHARTRLPAAYVERDVELAYAGTAHRVLGDAVDTSHVLVTDDTTREALYVAASRARHRTMLYVATETLLDVDADHPTHEPASPTQVLEQVLARATAETSTTEAIRQRPTPRTQRKRQARPEQRALNAASP